MEYYSAIKTNVAISNTWMHLENITLSEISRQRQILCEITYMWNLKIIQMNIYAETDLQTKKANL